MTYIVYVDDTYQHLVAWDTRQGKPPQQIEKVVFEEPLTFSLDGLSRPSIGPPTASVNYRRVLLHPREIRINAILSGREVEGIARRLLEAEMQQALLHQTLERIDDVVIECFD